MLKRNELCGVFMLGCISAGMIAGCSNQESEEPTSTTNGYYIQNHVWQKDTVTVCFANHNRVTDEEMKIIEDYVTNSWEQHIPLDFVGFKKCETGIQAGVADIVIDAYDGDGQCGASSVYGTVSLQTIRQGQASMRLPRNLNNCPQNSQDYLKYSVVHEFGHALSIAHEHLRTLNTPQHCGAQGSPEPLAKSHGEYDAESIMNYCYQTAELSAGDIATVKAMYVHLGSGPENTPATTDQTTAPVNPGAQTTADQPGPSLPGPSLPGPSQTPPGPGPDQTYPDRPDPSQIGEFPGGSFPNGEVDMDDWCNNVPEEARGWMQGCSATDQNSTNPPPGLGQPGAGRDQYDWCVHVPEQAKQWVPQCS